MSTNDASFYSLTPTSSPIPSIPSTAPLASPRDEPTAPSPSATVDEVQISFRDCFLACYPSLSQREAKTKAEKLPVGGLGLYTFSAEGFKEVFGPEGRYIHEIIHNGPYSYVILKTLSLIN